MADSGKAPPNEPKRVIDWERIEAEYRAGQLSLREIAATQHVSHVAILKRAKRDAWERNLSGAVREKLTARLVTDGVTGKSAVETIELAAERGVQIVREHRSVIGRARTVADRLLSDLESENAEGGLKDRSSTLVNLTNALKTIFGLEREAFSLNDAGGSSSDLPNVTDEHRARALAAFIAKTKAKSE